jgi:microsomal epoxide hydrolase
MSQPAPFKIHVDDAVLDDLRQRLARCRFPDEVPDNRWRYGTELAYLRSLVEYWRSGYDWRRHEAALNRFRQYKVRISGIELHFIHEEGRGREPMPLLVSHGWPGSVYEFHKLIPLLTRPEAHGGSARDAFHVVAPSLPGYGWSPPFDRPGGTPRRIAALFAQLMAALGYPRYGLQGGDWGAEITSWLAFDLPEPVAGLHLNMAAVRPHTGPGSARRARCGAIAWPTSRSRPAGRSRSPTASPTPPPDWRAGSWRNSATGATAAGTWRRRSRATSCSPTLRSTG